MIRPATLSDRKAIEQLGRGCLDLYPEMKPDTDRIHWLINECVSTRAHYAHVAEVDGVVRAVLLAATSDNLWAQRRNCNVVLWTSEVPTQGAALLRHFKRWVSERRAIRVAGMAPDCECDPRVWSLVERIGFEKRGGAYLHYN